MKAKLLIALLVACPILAAPLSNNSIIRLFDYSIIASHAEQVVDISGIGNKKFTVSVNVGNPMFA